jgi:hypothetical protein
LAADWTVRGAISGPGHQVRVGRKHRHGQADLGGDHLGGVPADAGHLVQAIHRIEWNARGVAVLAAARPWRLGGGDVGDELFDAGIEVFDLCAEGVYLLQQQGSELGLVVVEAAGERIDKGGVGSVALAGPPLG